VRLWPGNPGATTEINICKQTSEKCDIGKQMFSPASLTRRTSENDLINYINLSKRPTCKIYNGEAL
jgi:hypothetical protein